MLASPTPPAGGAPDDTDVLATVVGQVHRLDAARTQAATAEAEAAARRADLAAARDERTDLSVLLAAARTLGAREYLGRSRRVLGGPGWLLPGHGWHDGGSVGRHPGRGQTPAPLAVTAEADDAPLAVAVPWTRTERRAVWARTGLPLGVLGGSVAGAAAWAVGVTWPSDAAAWAAPVAVSWGTAAVLGVATGAAAARVLSRSLDEPRVRDDGDAMLRLIVGIVVAGVGAVVGYGLEWLARRWWLALGVTGTPRALAVTAVAAAAGLGVAVAVTRPRWRPWRPGAGGVAPAAAGDAVLAAVRAGQRQLDGDLAVAEHDAEAARTHLAAAEAAVSHVRSASEVFLAGAGGDARDTPREQAGASPSVAPSPSLQ